MNTTPSKTDEGYQRTLGQAIETKYLCPTNVRGSRIKAQCERGSVTIDYPDELNTEAAHRLAAHVLIQKFVKQDEKTGTPADKNPWNGTLYTGGLKGRGYCHVILPPAQD